MLGFIIGTACLIGLVATLRRAHYGRGGGCGAGAWGGRDRFGGPPWARGGWGGPGFRGRGGRRFFFSVLFERLGTTPQQEKVIVAALDELRDAGQAQRGELRKTRADVAAAVRSPSFDETRLGELFARHDAVLETLRKAAVGAIGKVHAVLDDRQREQLADLIETGPAAFRHAFHDHGGGGWRGYRGESHHDYYA